MGAGSFPAGSVIAGGDVFVRSPPVTKRSDGAKYDPFTKDAVVLSDGTIALVHYVDQIVSLQLGIELGTIPSAPLVGMLLSGIRKSSKATLQRTVEDAVKGALGSLLATQSIRINSITSVWAPGSYSWTTNYTNLVLPNARSRPVTGST